MRGSFLQVEYARWLDGHGAPTVGVKNPILAGRQSLPESTKPSGAWPLGPTSESLAGRDDQRPHLFWTISTGLANVNFHLVYEPASRRWGNTEKGSLVPTDTNLAPILEAGIVRIGLAGTQTSREREFLLSPFQGSAAGGRRAGLKGWKSRTTGERLRRHAHGQPIDGWIELGV